jgi:iron complex outermembrane receptor protein
MPKVRTGLNFSFNQEKRGLFIVWENDSLGYNPQGGVEDPFAEESSLAINYGRRIIVDPYIKWYDPYDNKHSFQNRAYYTLNESEGTNQSAAAYMMFSDYKFERKFENDLILITGLTGTWNLVDSELYGDHTSQNYSIYGQLEKNIGRFDFTFGVRGEYFQQNDLRADSYTYFNTDSTASMPIRPVFRAGTHYQLLEYTHLRVSGGQAFRYPSVAERFASTSVGALNIFPNSDLMPESGWSAEVGIKQGFKIKDFKGFIDVSAFINEYDNMMEFTFGFYEPDSVQFVNDPNSPLNIIEQYQAYVQRWLGFRAENAERARITGLELSINGTGNIGPVKVTTIMGYTYINPISLNRDSTYVYGQQLGPDAIGLQGGGFSDTSTNMLKYRFNHLVKGDVQLDYKKFSLGFSGRYNSFMRNIDGIFEQTIGEDIEILPGLKAYREANNRGDVVFDTRLGYRINDHFMVHFIVNNLFNREYMTRPGDIRAPRQFMLRVHAKF